MGFNIGTTTAPERLRVLIIDDDRVDRRVIRRHLDAGGLHARIDEAAAVADALSLARTGGYDCLLLDYRFPGGDAFELFGELMAESPATRPPIVLLTGSGDESIAAESIRRGAQAYLPKAAVGEESLREAIELALTQARQHRAEAERDAELTRMSFYDELTDLPNRRLFQERLEQAVRESVRGGPFAVLMMDLNLFKRVNDTHGHDVGDLLLRYVADRLRNVMRESDTVARLGGDEFAAVLSTADSLEGAVVVARKIQSAIDQPIAVGNHICTVGMSVGIAMCPEHGREPDALLRHADMALYQSKRTTCGITVHGSTRDKTGREAALIAQGLEGALGEEELFTMFQPQVRLHDGALVGAEALVRWSHPELGLLPPMKFVPAAEKSDAIAGMTYRVLELALRQNRIWRNRGLDLSVAVNLSARLLGRNQLADRVDSLIREAGVPHDALVLEVTESGIMNAPKAAERTMRRLADLGVRLSIDDFGTGYSSLKYLRDFPIDEIKIDGIFIEGLAHGRRDGLIVESVLALGDAFEARVVAEGIETDYEWSRLQELGCRFGQGYRAGPAMTAHDFDAWASEWDGGPAAKWFDVG